MDEPEPTSDSAAPDWKDEPPVGWLPAVSATPFPGQLDPGMFPLLRASNALMICECWPSVYFTEPLALSLHCAIHQPMVCGQLAKQAVAATNLLAGALGQPVNGSVITSW